MTPTARTRRPSTVAPTLSRVRHPELISSQTRDARAAFNLKDSEPLEPTDIERAQRLGFHIGGLPPFPQVEQENKTGLPDPLKKGIERLSGIALDDVKVYYNSPRPARLCSLAYAQGNEIHLGPGQERHLPHEAWHVVQQKQGRVRPMKAFGELAINDSSQLESEATVMGAKAEGRSATTFSLNAPISRGMVKPLQSAGKPMQLMGKEFKKSMAELVERAVHFATGSNEKDGIYDKTLNRQGRNRRFPFRRTHFLIPPKKPISPKKIMDDTLSEIAANYGQIRLDRGNPYLHQDDLD